MTADVLSYRSLIRNELQQVESLLLQSPEGVPTPIKEAIHNVVKAGGKRIRPALTILSAYLYNVDLEPVIFLASAIEMLHTATLIHDDLIDNASTRRGMATVNSHWSPGITVLAGDLAFSWAANLAAQANDTYLMKRFAETLAIICKGELNQMFLGRGHIPTRSDYYNRISAKTASLFIISTESGPILEGHSEQERKRLACFGEHLGLAFQIADDVLDFMGEVAALGKPIGSDLRQGLITLPILIYMENNPKDPRIKMLLADTTSDALLQAVLADLRRSNAAEQAMNIAEGHISAAIEILNAYPASPYHDALEEIAFFAVQRRY